MIARLRLRGAHPRARRSGRAYCEADRWSFDPRYTQGRCPICGWQPENAPNAPGWLALANRVDWDIVGLFLLADVLVLLGLIVANAAGLFPAGHLSFGLPSSPGGVASGARLH
jgi:hypothetical protein